MHITKISVRGFVTQSMLIASVFVAVISLLGVYALPLVTQPSANMYIEPTGGRSPIDSLFVITVMVDAKIPVNVFKGEIIFDPTILKVASIDYNTSIADLWAELPWYENGEGTINFTGGTTAKGGFQGVGSLITVTFRTVQKGTTAIRLEGARILAHNGLGTDVPLQTSVDAIFAVEESVIASETVATPEKTITSLSVIENPPSTDLNNDGRQTFIDIGIFLQNMLHNDARYDFNQDGRVDARDMGILIDAGRR